MLLRNDKSKLNYNEALAKKSTQLNVVAEEIGQGTDGFIEACY